MLPASGGSLPRHSCPKRPQGARDASHVWERGQRYGDDAVETGFGADVITPIFGTAGDAFLVDTEAVHKGALPTSSDQLILEVPYTLFPTIKGSVAPGAFRGYWNAAKPYAVELDFWRYCSGLSCATPRSGRLATNPELAHTCPIASRESWRRPTARRGTEHAYAGGKFLV